MVLNIYLLFYAMCLFEAVFSDENYKNKELINSENVEDAVSCSRKYLLRLNSLCKNEYF